MSFLTFDPSVPVAIIGAGTMGTKVAWATARSGIPTRTFDTSPGALEAAMSRAMAWSEGQERRTLEANLQPCSSLDETLAGVQLAFENVPEDLGLKRTVLADLGSRLAPEAYLGSNASALRCSPLAEASGRPERFFNLNWGDPRSMRQLELMGCAATAPQTLAFAKAWSRHMGMIPIHVKKEQMGYSFNRIWRVVKKEVLRQIAAGIADPHDIDRAWMLAFGTRIGPCGLMDMVSLPSVKNVELAYYSDSGEESDKPPPFLDEMIAQGKWGHSSGEGFYRYPNPAYEDPDWIAQSH